MRIIYVIVFDKLFSKIGIVVCLNLDIIFVLNKCIVTVS